MSDLPVSSRPDDGPPLSLVSSARGIEFFASIPQIPHLVAWVVYALLAMVAALCAWATVAKIDVIVVGQGRLIAPRQQLSLQVYETSVVKSLDVSIGQFVKKGQRLALLDPTFTNADRADYENQVASLKAALERCEAEISGKPYNPVSLGRIEEGQLRIYSDRKAEREAHVKSLVKKVNELKAQLDFARTAEPLLAGQVSLARETVDMFQKLVDKQLGEKHRLLEAKIKELEASSKLAENQHDQQKFQEQISGAIADRDSSCFQNRTESCRKNTKKAAPTWEQRIPSSQKRKDATI